MARQARTDTSGAKSEPLQPKAQDSPGLSKSRVRVRMYRQGLGDCFLVTIPREGNAPFQMLIDCGALSRSNDQMEEVVKHIQTTLIQEHPLKEARLDVVVGTHEHQDHLSGFNQARDVFDKIEMDAVWLAWTENLSQEQVKTIKSAKKRVVEKLRMASALGMSVGPLKGLDEVLGFEGDEADAGVEVEADRKSIAGALAYLKSRGQKAGGVKYLGPGEGPLEIQGAAHVRMYVLGPPRDPLLLKTSTVTKTMKDDDVIYHLGSMDRAGLASLGAAISSSMAKGGEDADLYQPFAAKHRIPMSNPAPASTGQRAASIEDFLKETYDNPEFAWRRVDDDWKSAVGQLALKLNSDTNNTSLVLALELVDTQEVLLFVGDAQVGSWRSWKDVKFNVKGRAEAMPAHELLERTVFYKVGHHGSHNATLKQGGLELMTHENLVAFIPLDIDTAGRKGWDMPAKPLLSALRKKTKGRVVISDANTPLSEGAKLAGVVEGPSKMYFDFFI